MSQSYALKAINIDLIVYDFDGVMTDNKAYVFQDGKEAVIVNRADGLGIDMIKKIGIPQLILSTETNPVVVARAAKLDLPVIKGVKDKELSLTKYCREHNVDLKKVLYVGNDINDKGALEIVGLPVVPSDAHEDVSKIAKIVLESKGGEGVVRELAGLLVSHKKNE